MVGLALEQCQLMVKPNGVHLSEVQTDLEVQEKVAQKDEVSTTEGFEIEGEGESSSDDSLSFEDDENNTCELPFVLDEAGDCVEIEGVDRKSFTSAKKIKTGRVQVRASRWKNSCTTTTEYDHDTIKCTTFSRMIIENGKLEVQYRVHSCPWWDILCIPKWVDHTEIPDDVTEIHVLRNPRNLKVRRIKFNLFTRFPLIPQRRQNKF